MSSSHSKTPFDPAPDNETLPVETLVTETSATPVGSRPKKNVTVPLVAGALAIGLVAFAVGRRSAPTEPPAEVGVVATENGEAAAGEGDEEAHADTVQFDAESAQLAGIQVRPVALSQLATNIPFNGQIAPNPNGVVRVASLVPGRVTRLNVAQGDTVKQGQVLAVVESRAIGEAQSAHQQAVARFENAQSNLNVVLKQAKAGVFSRAPIEAARRAQVEAQGDVRAQETAVRQAQTTLENVLRQARLGTFASPALEAARAQNAAATEVLKSAEAALTNARAAVEAAQQELERRRQLASSGAYVSRPVEEARRAVVAARSSRGAAQSEVATTRANLSRAKSLAAEGLVSQRDLEAAQQAFDTATARLETAQADENTAQQELERQQKLASTNVAGTAEVGAAQSTLATAQADVRTREAEVNRARESVKLAGIALSRERATFEQNIANRRETSQARSAAENARNALTKARQTLEVASAAYAREKRILSQNLNNIAQVQDAQSTYNAARAELKAARTALALFKSSPNDSASVPVRAPMAGVVQSRDVALGETVAADAPLMTLVNLNTVAVEAAIYEKDFARVRIGAPVTATVDAFPGRTFNGRITFLGSQLDPETRTLTARALLDNNGRLRPGMFARGHISTATGKLAVSVPSDAVQTMDGKTVVFVATGKPNEFAAREVKTGATAKGATEIKSGLKPGEKIVAKGAFVVKSQAMKSELAEE
jgi:cobalt-zinc-cadmium efflux system membrane fusion protein